MYQTIWFHDDDIESLMNAVQEWLDEEGDRIRITSTNLGYNVSQSGVTYVIVFTRV